MNETIDTIDTIDTIEEAGKTGGNEMKVTKGMVKIREVAGIKEEKTSINPVLIVMETVTGKNKVIFYVNPKVTVEIREGPITFKEAKTEIQGPDLLTINQEGTIRDQPTKNIAKVEATLVKRGHHERMHRAQSQNRSQKNDQPAHVVRDRQVRGDRNLPVQ